MSTTIRQTWCTPRHSTDYRPAALFTRGRPPDLNTLGAARHCRARPHRYSLPPERHQKNCTARHYANMRQRHWFLQLAAPVVNAPASRRRQRILWAEERRQPAAVTDSIPQSVPSIQAAVWMANGPVGATPSWLFFCISTACAIPDAHRRRAHTTAPPPYQRHGIDSV